MRLLLAATLVLAVALPAWAAEGTPLWLPGDAWTWSVAGAAEGERSATAARDGAGWRTAEVERTHPPGAPLDATETRITRAWVAPLRLASEEHVSRHCVPVPLASRACGNLTERWTYEPALELVRRPLVAGQSWQQAVHVVHTVDDEVGVDQSVPSDETRHFAVAQARTVTLPMGALVGWDISMDNEPADLDGTSTILTYGDAAQHLLGWTDMQGGGASRVQRLSALGLQPRGAPPPSPPPPPPPSAPPSPPPSSPPSGPSPSPSSPSGAGSGGGSLGPGTSGVDQDPAASPTGHTAPPASPATGSPGLLGPPRERDLREAPAVPAAAALAALAALAMGAKRRR